MVIYIKKNKKKPMLWKKTREDIITTGEFKLSYPQHQSLSY